MTSIRNFLTVFFVLIFGALSFSAQAQKQNETNPDVMFKGCQVFVPNAFTPNGDDLNDKFTVKYNPDCQVQEYALRIFDRWGRLVFETNAFEENQAWDGRSQGKELNAGVYMWRLTMKMVNINGNGESVAVNKQGSLVLIR